MMKARIPNEKNTFGFIIVEDLVGSMQVRV
jgi:hypothetical protein